MLKCLVWRLSHLTFLCFVSHFKVSSDVSVFSLALMFCLMFLSRLMFRYFGWRYVSVLADCLLSRFFVCLIPYLMFLLTIVFILSMFCLNILPFFLFYPFLSLKSLLSDYYYKKNQIQTNKTVGYLGRA